LSLPNTIAVDGPAGSGKSTVAFAVSQRIEYLFIDTGAFYRAITLLAIERQLNFDDPQQIAQLAQKTRLDMTPDPGDDQRQYTLLADGEDITLKIHSPLVDSKVSVVAANPAVRDALMDVQRMVARRGKAILAGRDIGTVVLPDADLKVYIDASLDIRAERRYQQRIDNGETADLDAIREAMRARDQYDSSRKTAPLQRANDAIYLDTTTLTLDESIEALYQIIKQHQSVKTEG